MTAFRDLHVPGAPLVMPNPWDAGSARMLETLGFRALASTSAGAAFSRGKQDGGLTRDQMIAAAHTIADAVSVPVSADLENGGGDSPDDAAEAVRGAAASGLAGASIEDLGAGGIYPFDLALDRVHAAIDAARATGIVLTARSEGLLTGTLSRDEVCQRIAAFAHAGADVVFAPGLRTAEDVQAVMDAAGDTPVSVLVGGNSPDMTVERLGALGVARISVGSGLARVAYGGIIAMMRDALETGRFDYPATTASFDEIADLLR